MFIKKILMPFFLFIIFTSLSCSSINSRKKVRYQVNQGEGIIIVAEHGISRGGGTHSQQKALDCEIMVTDKNGYFTLNRFSWFLLAQHYTWLVIVKPGYMVRSGFLDFNNQTSFPFIQFQLTKARTQDDKWEASMRISEIYKKNKNEIADVMGTCSEVLNKVSDEEYTMLQKQIEKWELEK